MVNNYQHIIERMYQLFLTCPDPNKSEKPEGWTVKQVLGHLVDSLNNNHQRLARYVPEGHLLIPEYDPNQFNKRGYYDSFDYHDLLALWLHYNKLYLHIINNIPQNHYASTIAISEKPVITLGELITKFYEHVEIHEKQIHRILNS